MAAQGQKDEKVILEYTVDRTTSGFWMYIDDPLYGIIASNGRSREGCLNNLHESTALSIEVGVKYQRPNFISLNEKGYELIEKK